MNGLIIRSPYVDWILAGKKSWEIRGRYTHVRGNIALIRGGSGLIVGTSELVGVVGPLSLRELRTMPEAQSKCNSALQIVCRQTILAK